MAKAKVIFREESCKGCGLCVEACPKKIITLDTDKINLKGYNPAVIKNMEDCIGCGNCALMCPDMIISVARL
ncbi:MAG: 4Fe-4S binding protein [Spirochaetales bacterium]|nr:4Fe-4S binding protein [Spirochaetales bacterium]